MTGRYKAMNNAFIEFANDKRACAICGELILKYQSHLERHCQRQHQGNVEGFLRIGDEPYHLKYLNFHEFQNGTSKALIPNLDYSCSRAGRPSKRRGPLRENADPDGDSHDDQQKAEATCWSLTFYFKLCRKITNISEFRYLSNIS